MEEHHKEHILKNYVELIKLTTCSTHLITALQQKRVLGQDDAEILELQTLTGFQKSKKLYEILFTKLGSYDVLVECLKLTKLSGALRLLTDRHEISRQFGKISYDKNHVLGTGCFGTKVFQGTFGGRDVAIKVLNSDIIDQQVALQEIDLLKKLDGHENIVRYFTAEVCDNFIYIVLELCLVSLEDEVNMKLVNTDTATILIKCTQGIAYLHRNNVIHRDLKPANILLNYNDQVKISDFGLSKQISAGVTSISFRSGVVGTADWMAPEILNALAAKTRDELPSPKWSTASDIFSLGCVFYFTLTNGLHPFGDPMDRQYNIRHNKLEIDGMDSRWKHLIETMLATDSRQRPSADATLVSVRSKQEPLVSQAACSTKSSQAQIRKTLAGNVVQNVFGQAVTTNESNPTSSVASFQPQPRANFNPSTYDDNVNQIANLILYPAERTLPTPKEIRDFLDSSSISSAILVVSTFNLSLCISRIQGCVSENLPVVELTFLGSYSQISESLSGPVYIAKSYIFGEEEFEVLNRLKGKVIVVTNECIVTKNEIQNADDILSWNMLPYALQQKLVENMKECYRDDEPAEVINLLGDCMLNLPQVFTKFDNEHIVNLLKSNVMSSSISVLVHCVLDHHIKVYAELRKVEENVVVEHLASCSGKLVVKSLVFKMFYLVNNFFNNFQADMESYFANRSILRKNKSRINGSLFTDKRFENYVIAKFFSMWFNPNEYLGLSQFDLGPSNNFSSQNGLMLLQYLNLTGKENLPKIFSEQSSNEAFFKICFEQGLFNILLQWFPHCYESTLTNLKMPLECRIPSGNAQLINQYMQFYENGVTKPVWDAETFKSNFCIDITPLHVFIQRNNFYCVELLLRKYNYQKRILEKSMCGLLHFCCTNTLDLNQDTLKSRFRVIKLILKLSPELVTERFGEKKMLPQSVPNVHVEVIKYLIEKGKVGIKL